MATATKHIKSWPGNEIVKTYNFAADGNRLTINGRTYKVVQDWEFAIKILKTQIKAINGAEGLIKFFMREPSDSWEIKVIENCRPIA